MCYTLHWRQLLFKQMQVIAYPPSWVLTSTRTFAQNYNRDWKLRVTSLKHIFSSALQYSLCFVWHLRPQEISPRISLSKSKFIITSQAVCYKFLEISLNQIRCHGNKPLAPACPFHPISHSSASIQCSISTIIQHPQFWWGHRNAGKWIAKRTHPLSPWWQLNTWCLFFQDSGTDSMSPPLLL